MLTGLYAKLIGVGLILVLAAAAVFYVKSLRSDVQRLEAEKTVLVSQIEEQNRAVEALKVAADERLAQAAKDLEQAKAEANKKKANAGIIYKRPPTDPVNLCGSALDLMNGGVK